jgi:hypothetical protein
VVEGLGGNLVDAKDKPRTGLQPLSLHTYDNRAGSNVSNQEWTRLREEYEARLHEERRRARDAGQEYADVLDLGIELDPGAPLPHVLADGHSVFVLFYVRARSRVRDGITVAVADPRSTDEPVGLIEFTGVHSVLFGGPNDEALHGHPLHGRGLEPYAIHEVYGSHWISEAERINSVHPYHQPGWHGTLRHFLITFHDETLECLARDLRAEIHRSSLADTITTTASRMFGGQ